jgi:dipeptidyl-peptidase-4
VVAGSGGVLASGGIARTLASSAASPDGRFNAVSRDGNVVLIERETNAETKVTTDGDIGKRIRYGMPTIVYGEELGAGLGLWWSPDSKRVAYYKFNEGHVKDYYLVLELTAQYPRLVVDPYPKAGIQSPQVDLFIYDLETKKSTQVDVRSGKPYGDDALGYYVYRVNWSLEERSERELLFCRMNRKQNTIEVCAADPATGQVRVIVHDEWLKNYVDHQSPFVYLRDRKRFIWGSDRNGFRNYYLYDMTGKQITPLTQHEFDCGNLLKIDEENNSLYYMARDGENYQKQQLHRVGLDGKNHVRLTDREFNHTVTIAPDNTHFVDVYQTHDLPAATRVVDMNGKVVAELAKSDLSRFEEIGLKKIEVFTFKTLDGTAELHGMLHFPSNFDPQKKYPILLTVYGGPETSRLRETFATPNQLTEYGFLVAEVDARSLSGRGRKFSDPFFHNLGIVEMDDHAAGIKELLKRPYTNGKVGVFGTSYGGTVAATLILRYPDLFQAASASSAVTDYRNYNDIYPERFNGLVSENKEGYDKATVMTYVQNLKGALLIFYGTADNNVHPSNSMQLIRALQQAGKSFEVQLGPDQGHVGVNQQRMMEFFIENLVMR